MDQAGRFETSATAQLRVAVVGARRVRQGTGPFLALHAARAGAAIAAVLGTREETAAEASAWLAERGAPAQGYAEWPTLLRREQPQAVIVASPSGSHLTYLRDAGQAGAHVLCEKPLLAGLDPRGGYLPAGELPDEELAAAFARRFAAAGLVLAEICQWPHTLGAFRALHPDVDLTRVERFEMRMAPPREGLERWLEVLSHPLSLLQAVAPGPASLERIEYDGPGRVRFDFLAHGRRIHSIVEASPSHEYPRPAWYSFDHAECRRHVEEPDYSFFFEDATGRRVPAEDPAAALVADFLARAERASACCEAPVDEDLVRRQGLLRALLEAWRP